MSVVLLAEFDCQEALLAAIDAVREKNTRIVDAFTPYPIAGLGKSLGASPFRVRAAMLIGGMGSAVLAWLVEWYSAAINFPFDSGSRPHNSWPVFPLFPFEFGVLMAGIFGFVALLYSTSQLRLNHPFFDSPLSGGASQDRFLLAVEIPSAKRARAALETTLAKAGASQVSEAML